MRSTRPIFTPSGIKMTSARKPCCPECLSIVSLRDDGLTMNHRDQTGDPCPGSRMEPRLVARATPQRRNK